MKFTRLGKLLGKLGFGYCPDCGTKMTFDHNRAKMGYITYYKCPHCGYLDRFDVDLENLSDSADRILKEYITTVVDDEHTPEELPRVDDTTAFMVGLGFVTAVVIFSIWLIIK